MTEAHGLNLTDMSKLTAKTEWRPNLQVKAGVVYSYYFNNRRYHVKATQSGKYSQFVSSIFENITPKKYFKKESDLPGFMLLPGDTITLMDVAGSAVNNNNYTEYAIAVLSNNQQGVLPSYPIISDQSNIELNLARNYNKSFFETIYNQWKTPGYLASLYMVNVTTPIVLNINVKGAIESELLYTVNSGLPNLWRKIRIWPGNYSNNDFDFTGIMPTLVGPDIYGNARYEYELDDSASDYQLTIENISGTIQFSMI